MHALKHSKGAMGISLLQHGMAYSMACSGAAVLWGMRACTDFMLDENVQMACNILNIV